MKDNIKLLQELDKTIKIEFKNNIKQILFNSDKEQLSRVFLNLIKNSIESIQQKTEKVVNFNKIINDHNGNIEFIPINEGAKIKIIFKK